MLIYRVEHRKYKLGPFIGAYQLTNWPPKRGAGHVEWDRWRHVYIGNAHPSPYSDSNLLGNFFSKAARNRRVVHGVASLHSVRFWFGPVLCLLHEANFVLNVYEITNTKWFKEGKKQVLFCPRFAKLINTLSLLEVE